VAATGNARSESGSGLDLVQKATIALRQMIVRRELSAGEQIRQVELAEKLGLSRSPLREALRSLETEGLVAHVPNRGYFVVRLSADDLRQIYRMRRLLETEVLLSVRRPSAAELDDLRAANEAVEQAAEAPLGEVLTANRTFHFMIFALSPLDLINREIQRLWHVSEPYRAAYLSASERRTQIAMEHRAMLEALAEYDLAKLVETADEHRRIAGAAVVRLLTI
jgi:DNA-binding GntR family transcriptional regulator